MSEEMKVVLPDWMSSDDKRTVVFLIISGVALGFSFFLPENFTAIDPAWVSVVLCGLPILKEAVEGLISRFDIKADVLVSLALIASVLIGETFAAGEIAWIMTIGSFLEELTVEKARAGIAELVKLSPQTARVIKNGQKQLIGVDEVQVGDLIQVLPSEKVPVDGMIIDGETAVDESLMTGESMPIDKQIGDEVMSGTINCFGAFVMRATRVGEDSSVKRLIALVKSADSNKTKIVRLADLWATWIVVGALTSAAVTWYVTGEVVRAVTILVVFCPCALVLATPTAVMAAIGNATKKGFLVREGDALERLAEINKTAFDKTGTLTEGKPIVVEVQASDSFEKETVFRYAACVEQFSEHPLGKAIVASYLQTHPNENLESPSNFEMLPGQGARAILEGNVIGVGSLRLKGGEKKIYPYEKAIMDKAERATKQGKSVSFVYLNNTIIGYVALEDKIRTFSAKVINNLRDLNVGSILLTGDKEAAAKYVAKAVGINEVVAECLPQTKLSMIEEGCRKGEKLLMVGDGTNDAPALRRAHVGIAMGAIGSDVAVEAADIVAVTDRIEAIPQLVRLSRKMMKVIKINLTLAMGINFVAIVLAMFGWMGPVVGALIHNAGSVAVIIHSVSLLKVEQKDC